MGQVRRALVTGRSRSPPAKSLLLQRLHDADRQGVTQAAAGTADALDDGGARRLDAVRRRVIDDASIM